MQRYRAHFVTEVSILWSNKGNFYTYAYIIYYRSYIKYSIRHLHIYLHFHTVYATALEATAPTVFMVWQCT